MKIFDISRPYFHTPVYPGDPVPSLSWLSRVEKGEGYNLSSFSGCVHTATHADAPLHVWSEGQTIDKMPLELFYGECFVVSASGILTEEWVDQLMMGKKKRRVLIHGNQSSYLSEEAARLLAKRGIFLLGTDASSIGNGKSEYEVHRLLLSQGIAILEGLNLSQVTDGEYLLCAFPIKLDGAEGAPVRAVLVQNQP